MDVSVCLSLSPSLYRTGSGGRSSGGPLGVPPSSRHSFAAEWAPEVCEVKTDVEDGVPEDSLVTAGDGRTDALPASRHTADRALRRTPPEWNRQQNTQHATEVHPDQGRKRKSFEENEQTSNSDFVHLKRIKIPSPFFMTSVSFLLVIFLSKNYSHHTFSEHESLFLITSLMPTSELSTSDLFLKKIF